MGLGHILGTAVTRNAVMVAIDAPNIPLMWAYHQCIFSWGALNQYCNCDFAAKWPIKGNVIKSAFWNLIPIIWVTKPKRIVARGGARWINEWLGEFLCFAFKAVKP